MKEHIILVSILGLLLSSCSTKSEKKKDNGLGSEFIIEEPNGPSEEDGIVSLDEGLYEEIDDDLSEKTNYAADNIYDDMDKVEAYNESVKEDVIKVLSDDFQMYTVKEGETLMWIAFKVYGDYKEWKKLKLWNEDKLNFNNQVEPGTAIKYQPLATKHEWKGAGSPYLVKNGDTLFLISKDVYNGNGNYWRDIWQNNQIQIKDPNLIFAGFTLFYRPMQEVRRELANEEE